MVKLQAFVCERGLALRGDNKSIGSRHNGNLLRLLALVKELPYTFSESHSFFFLISCTSHIFYRVYAVVFVLCIYALPLLFLIVAYAGMYHSVKLISRRHSRPHCSDVSAAAIRHSLSTPDLAVHDSVISTRQFFSDKNNQRLAVDIKGTDRHWRKISAHACLSRPQPALSRCNSERERTITTSGYHPTENLVAASIDHSNNINTGGSLTSLIRKGSRICSRGLRRTVISLQQQRPNGREERAAAATCLIIVTTFLLLVSPYFVLFILQAFHIDRKVLHGQTKRSRDDSVWNTVSVLLLYLNCIATPAIYVLRDCVVRDEVRHLWLRCCSHRTSKHPLPSRDSANCSITAALAGSSLRLRPAGSALFTIGVIHERD